MSQVWLLDHRHRQGTERKGAENRLIDAGMVRPYNRGVRSGGGPSGAVRAGWGRCGLFRAVRSLFEEP